MVISSWHGSFSRAKNTTNVFSKGIWLILGLLFFVLKLWLFVLLFIVCMWWTSYTTETEAAPPTYTIATFKNGQPIATRDVEPIELRHAAIALTTAFKDQTPSYALLVSAAKDMTAKDRCFNLYSSRAAMTSVVSGMLDASSNAKEFLKNSIASIEKVNNQTQITCELRQLP